VKRDPTCADGTPLERWLSRYRTVAVLLLNTIVLFLAVNALLWMTFKIRDAFRPARNPEGKYSSDSLTAVYPGLTVGERQALLQETWSRPLVYDDQALFKEGAITGKYVNVDAAGFRLSKDQGPWPPSPANLNIFVFGGSTTFGYGVPDWQTVPSYLQESLSRGFTRKRVCVYNFGVGYFYSTYERVRFEKLLVEGVKPHIAFFIDGINDCAKLSKEPTYRNRFQKAFQDTSEKTLVTVAWDRTPIGRLANFVNRFMREHPETIDEDQRPDGHAEAPRIISDYLANKQLVEAVCHQWGIRPIFVWQPHPCYQYDAKYHLFIQPRKHWPSAMATYDEMGKLHESGQLGKDFLWCADLQKDEKECLYVDNVHYTAKFSSKLAETISAMCFKQGLPDGKDWR
jgi:hypothetical protein